MSVPFPRSSWRYASPADVRMYGWPSGRSHFQHVEYFFLQFSQHEEDAIILAVVVQQVMSERNFVIFEGRLH